MVQMLNPQGVVQIPGRSFSFSDPALQFGSAGVFETIRVEEGCLHLFEAHWDRLLKSLEFLEIPTPLSRDRIQDLLAREIADFPQDAQLRLRLTVGIDPDHPPESGLPPLRAFAEARSLDVACMGPVSARPALRLHLFPDYGLPSTDPWNNHKTTRYFAHIEARRRAQLRGFDEALLLNEFGNVVEASAHNLFWINDSCLISPPSDAGGLPGTFAAWLRSATHRMGIEHRTANAWMGEIRQADSIFLTNAIGEVRKVSLLEDMTVPPLQSTDIGRLILDQVEKDRRLRMDLDLGFHR